MRTLSIPLPNIYWALMGQVLFRVKDAGLIKESNNCSKKSYELIEKGNRFSYKLWCHMINATIEIYSKIQKKKIRKFFKKYNRKIQQRRMMNWGKMETLRDERTGWGKMVVKNAGGLKTVVSQMLELIVSEEGWFQC